MVALFRAAFFCLPGARRKRANVQTLIQTCETAYGTISLERWPPKSKDQLRAWDQADQLLLETAKERENSGRILILNDPFGALTTALRAFQPVLWSDSAACKLAALHNLQLNGTEVLDFVPGDTKPDGTFGLVLARVPKSLTFWKSQMAALPSVVTSETTILASGMTKHLPKRAQEIMKQTLGEGQRHQAVRKARILEGRLTGDCAPVEVEHSHYDHHGLTLRNLPNLFSRKKLDEGTQLLISTFEPEKEREGEILDFACGNGVVGLALQQQYPNATLTFADVSYQAVRSAELNFDRHFERPATFLALDGLRDYQGSQFDLIALNPPFHEGHQVGDSIAWRLINDACRHLSKGGELRLVGNRHLAYHAKMKRIFGNSEVVKSSQKFVVLRSIKG